MSTLVLQLSRLGNPMFRHLILLIAQEALLSGQEVCCKFYLHTSFLLLQYSQKNSPLYFSPLASCCSEHSWCVWPARMRKRNSCFCDTCGSWCRLPSNASQTSTGTMSCFVLSTMRFQSCYQCGLLWNSGASCWNLRFFFFTFAF